MAICLSHWDFHLSLSSVPLCSCGMGPKLVACRVNALLLRHLLASLQGLPKWKTLPGVSGLKTKESPTAPLPSICALVMNKLPKARPHSYGWEKASSGAKSSGSRVPGAAAGLGQVGHPQPPDRKQTDGGAPAGRFPSATGH